MALLIVVAVPDFALVLGVLGSACSFTVTIAFPCACYLRLYWDEVRPHMSTPPRAHTRNGVQTAPLDPLTRKPPSESRHLLLVAAMTASASPSWPPGRLCATELSVLTLHL
jgi:hypothetical protein